MAKSAAAITAAQWIVAADARGMAWHPRRLRFVIDEWDEAAHSVRYRSGGGL